MGLLAYFFDLQEQSLEFNWRLAFSGLVPHMEHCVKVVLDEVCAKNLQQEEALNSSGHISVSLSPIAEFSVNNKHLKEDSLCNFSERETPKMIAKVPLKNKQVYLAFI